MSSFSLMSSPAPSLLSLTKYLRSTSQMLQTGAIASSSFFIADNNSVLRVEGATGSTPSTEFSSSVLTALAADSTSSTAVVILAFLNLVSTEFVILFPDVDGFKVSLGAVHPVEEVRATVGYRTLLQCAGTSISVWSLHHQQAPSLGAEASELRYSKSLGNGFVKCWKYQSDTASPQTDISHLHPFLLKGLKRVDRNILAELFWHRIEKKTNHLINFWRWLCYYDAHTIKHKKWCSRLWKSLCLLYWYRPIHRLR